jgi:hypothetical protein
MKTWARKTLAAGILAAGALLLAPSAAQADPAQSTMDNIGTLNATQVLADVAVPVNAVATSIGVAGESWATGQAVNFVPEKGEKRKGRGPSQISDENRGTLNGTQVLAIVQAPINVVGTSASVLGYSTAQGAGVNHVESDRAEKGHKGDKGGKGGPDQVSGQNFGTGNGTQIKAPIKAPINICGTSLGVLGLSNSQAVCGNRVGGESGHKQVSGKNFGTLNGTQALLPIAAPINLTGTSAAVGGTSTSTAASGNDLESGSKGGDKGPDQVSGQNFGTLNGTQAKAPIQIPVNLCGTSIAVLGYSQSSAACGNDLGDGKGGKGQGNWGGNQGGNHGHHGGGHNGGNHGGQAPDDVDGDNGENPDDGEYKGDNGQNPDDNGGSQGGQNNGGYGDSNPRTMKTQEGGAASKLSNGLTNLGGLSNVTGLLGR